MPTGHHHYHYWYWHRNRNRYRSWYWWYRGRYRHRHRDQYRTTVSQEWEGDVRGGSDCTLTSSKPRERTLYTEHPPAASVSSYPTNRAERIRSKRITINVDRRRLDACILWTNYQQNPEMEKGWSSPRCNTVHTRVTQSLHASVTSNRYLHRRTASFVQHPVVFHRRFHRGTAAAREWIDFVCDCRPASPSGTFSSSHLQLRVVLVLGAPLATPPLPHCQQNRARRLRTGNGPTSTSSAHRPPRKVSTAGLAPSASRGSSHRNLIRTSYIS